MAWGMAPQASRLNAEAEWRGGRNGLTDGEMKYVFDAFTATEQLFNLSSDPHDALDVAADPHYAAALALWRSRLLQQWQAEGRGAQWYDAHGNLLQRLQHMPYSPNFPRSMPTPSSPWAADDIVS